MNATRPTTSALMDVREVASLLRVSTKTVRRWIDNGEVPSIRVGGTIRIDPADLEHVMYSGHRGALTRG